MSPANTTPPAVGVAPLITGKRVLNFQDVAPLCCGRTRSAAHWAAEFTYKVNGVQRVCAVKGGVFQWVQVPPGKCSSRKLPEQLWR